MKPRKNIQNRKCTPRNSKNANRSRTHKAGFLSKGNNTDGTPLIKKRETVAHATDRNSLKTPTSQNLGIQKFRGNRTRFAKFRRHLSKQTNTLNKN